MPTKRRPAAGLFAAVLAALAMATTACGISGSTKDASSSSQPPGSSGAPSSDAASPSGPAYAQCMRSHGVTDFPDPGGSNHDQFLISGKVQGNPNFATASKACESLRPQQQSGGGNPGITQDQLLALAKCMRANGVPDFPDPGPGGQINVAGVDPNNPNFAKATQICAAKTGLQIGGQ